MLRNKVVIVTGSAMGIGRYIAHTFAEEGARLVLADIEEARMASVAGELQAKGAETLTVKADVRNEAEVQRLVEQVVAAFGQIDVLINNAGIATHFGSPIYPGAWMPLWPRIRDMEEAFWNTVMDTNLGGTFRCTKHVLPQMEKQRSGHIVNLYGGGSGAGSCVYVVSKEAIRVFTRHVAEEEREFDICIMAMSPGGTIATENAPEEVRNRIPGPELAGNRFVLAAEAGMDYTGKLVDWQDGQLVARA
jgi:3-oxoacyl-[acyl-carrier protein] reductase